ncbi:MAG TPA: heme-binding protein [Steroidobacteraceae bacterium]|nr:heme-binding protein [Steroidobacteraceae bacterium]
MATRWKDLLRAPGASLVSMALLACGGGGSTASPPGAVDPGTPACTGSCASAASFLTQAEVERVIAQAVAEAQARGVSGTIAVSDRVGNVLAVFRMTGAASSVTVRSTDAGAPVVSGGLEGVNLVPDTLAAIAKAVTAAFLSSEGNAFSTRTASQIIQEHFNPGEALTPGGPLFGVQFSQLPCSDLSRRFAGGAADAGPKRSPLGLAGDPGGLPLYKGGTPVGGVGVIVDGLYGIDRDIANVDVDLDELLALAGTFGLAAPDDRRAERITADGKTLRFSDATFDRLASDPATAPAFAAIDGVAGMVVTVPGYATAVVRAGLAFGQPASGVRPDALDYPGLDAFVLVDETDTERFRPQAGTEPVDALTEAEVRELLRRAIGIANRARAQIRRPLGSPARVSATVVDSSGVILGIARSRDAPVFGIDVSVQKARSAAFLSSVNAAAAINGVPDAEYLAGGLVVLRSEPLGQYVTALRAFLGLPNALADGELALSARAVGNLARPFYPDGVDGAAEGPFSKPAGEWSAFSSGLQLDLSYNAVVQHVGFVLGAVPDVGTNCTGVTGLSGGFAVGAPIAALANGLQIFPGSVPIYRDRTLVGGIGVSGDGVDQDDMVAFLAVDEAAASLGTLNNAPADMRTDQLTPGGARLRYVNCPQAPFLDSDAPEVCSGR